MSKRPSPRTDAVAFFEIVQGEAVAKALSPAGMLAPSKAMRELEWELEDAHAAIERLCEGLNRCKNDRWERDKVLIHVEGALADASAITARQTVEASS